MPSAVFRSLSDGQTADSQLSTYFTQRPCRCFGTTQAGVEDEDQRHVTLPRNSWHSSESFLRRNWAHSAPSMNGARTLGGLPK